MAKAESKSLKGIDIKGNIGEAVGKKPSRETKDGPGLNRLSLKMPSDLHLRLKIASAKTRRTMAEICFEAIEKELDLLEKKIGR